MKVGLLDDAGNVNKILYNDDAPRLHSYNEVFTETFQQYLQILFSRFSASASAFAIGLFIAELAPPGDTEMLGSGGLINVYALGCAVWLASIPYAVGPLVSNALGEQRDKPDSVKDTDITAIVEQGHKWAWRFIPASIGAVWLFPWIGQTQRIATIVNHYFRIFSLGIPAIFLQVPYQKFAFAKKDKESMALSIGISFTQLGLTIGLSRVLAFEPGLGLGITGLAWAQTLRSWIGLFLYMSAYKGLKHYQQYDFNLGSSLPWSCQRHQDPLNSSQRVWQTGWPIMILRGTEIFPPLILMLLASSLEPPEGALEGTPALSVQKVLAQCLFLLLVLPFSAMLTGRHIVAKAIGAGNNDINYRNARRFGLMNNILSTLFSLPGALTLLIKPEWIASWFIDINNPVNFPVIRPLIPLMRLTGIVHVADSVRLASAGNLQGFRDRETQAFDVKGATVFNATPLLIGLLAAVVGVVAFDGDEYAINIPFFIAIALAAISTMGRWQWKSQQYKFFRTHAHSKEGVELITSEQQDTDYAPPPQIQ